MSNPIQKVYKAVMSRGDDVQLDPEDVEVLMAAIENGTPARVKRGIINPSFLISIVEDKDRIRNFLDDTKYNDERSLKKREAGMKALPDIFSETLAALPPPRSG